MDTRAALKQAISIVGSQKNLANRLTALAIPGPDGKPLAYTQQSVSGWVIRGYPPAEVCRGIETITENEVTRYDLRPDVFRRQAGAAA